MHCSINVTVHFQLNCLFISIAAHENVYTLELVSLRCYTLRDYVNFMNFIFLISKCHFKVGI